MERKEVGPGPGPSVREQEDQKAAQPLKRWPPLYQRNPVYRRILETHFLPMRGKGKLAVDNSVWAGGNYRRRVKLWICYVKNVRD